MHEFAMCERIVRATLDEYAGIEPPPKRLARIHVVAGGMHQIIPETLQFAYEVLTKETPAEGSTMDLTISPVLGRCRACGWEGDLDLPFFECGACRELDIEVVSGMEMYLDKLQIEES